MLGNGFMCGDKLHHLPITGLSDLFASQQEGLPGGGSSLDASQIVEM